MNDRAFFETELGNASLETDAMPLLHLDMDTYTRRTHRFLIYTRIDHPVAIDHLALLSLFHLDRCCMLLQILSIIHNNRTRLCGL